MTATKSEKLSSDIISSNWPEFGHLGILREDKDRHIYFVSPTPDQEISRLNLVIVQNLFHKAVQFTPLPTRLDIDAQFLSVGEPEIREHAQDEKGGITVRNDRFPILDTRNRRIVGYLVGPIASHITSALDPDDLTGQRKIYEWQSSNIGCPMVENFRKSARRADDDKNRAVCQASHDWTRGSKSHTYQIDGIGDEVVAGEVANASETGMRDFFGGLISNEINEGARNHLVDKMMDSFMHGGLMHSGNNAVFDTIGSTGMPEPEQIVFKQAEKTTVRITPTEQGFRIRAVSDFTSKTLENDEQVQSPPGTYFGRVETELFVVAKTHGCEVHLTQLKVDYPDRDFAGQAPSRKEILTKLQDAYLIDIHTHPSNPGRELLLTPNFRSMMSWLAFDPRPKTVTGMFFWILGLPLTGCKFIGGAIAYGMGVVHERCLQAALETGRPGRYGYYFFAGVAAPFYLLLRATFLPVQSMRAALHYSNRRYIRYPLAILSGLITLSAWGALAVFALPAGVLGGVSFLAPIFQWGAAIASWLPSILPISATQISTLILSGFAVVGVGLWRGIKALLGWHFGSARIPAPQIQAGVELIGDSTLPEYRYIQLPDKGFSEADILRATTKNHKSVSPRSTTSRKGSVAEYGPTRKSSSASPRSSQVKATSESPAPGFNSHESNKTLDKVAARLGELLPQSPDSTPEETLIMLR